MICNRRLFLRSPAAALRTAAGFGLLAPLGACTGMAPAAGTDAAAVQVGSGLRRLPATATLTLGEVQIGQTREELAARVGEMIAEVKLPAAARYQRGDGTLVHAAFDAPGPQGRAREIHADAAHVEGHRVLWAGLSPEAVQAVVLAPLGKGERRAPPSPGGGGAASTAPAGEAWEFTRGGVAWTFFFDKGRALTGIMVRAAPAPAPASSPAAERGR